MRLIASLAVVAIAISFSATASAGIFHKSACCDAAPAPSCGCEVAAPSCGCEVDPCCTPARKHLLKGMIAKLHARKASCCETAVTCCEPAPAPCCAPVVAPAPSCGCEVAAPSCGCEVDPCCKPARKHVLKNFFSKICARKSSCCEPAPSCGCEVVEPSCGCN